MRLFVSAMLNKEFVRFAIIGALNTLLGICTFPILFWSFGDRVNVNIILLASYVIGPAFAFTMHRRVTFGSRGTIGSEGARFIVLTAVIWALNAVLLNLALHFFSINTVVVQTVIAMALQLGNYVILKHFVFTVRGSKA